MNIHKDSYVYRKAMRENKIEWINHSKYMKMNNNNMNTFTDQNCNIYTDVMNILLICHKRKFGGDNLSMFSNLNSTEKNATNRQMEFYYEEMMKYYENEKDRPERNIIYTREEFEDDFKDVKLDEAYFLKVNGELEKISLNLFALAIYLASLDNWELLKWEITPAI